MRGLTFAQWNCGPRFKHIIILLSSRSPLWTLLRPGDPRFSSLNLELPFWAGDCHFELAICYFGLAIASWNWRKWSEAWAGLEITVFFTTDLSCSAVVGLKLLGWGAHDERRRHELLRGSRGMLPRDIFKYEVSGIAFLSFWEQFPPSNFSNWL